MLPEYFPYMTLGILTGPPRLDPPDRDDLFSPADIPLGTATKGRNKHVQKRRQKQQISKASRRRNRS